MTLTLEEKEKILVVAEGLLREPESWTRGRWKCPVGHDGMPKVDDNGQKVYSYCIQGAVNQAAVDVLGRERVRGLGLPLEPGHPDAPEYHRVNDELQGPVIAEALELDEIVIELHAEEMGWTAYDWSEHEFDGHLSLSFNDSDFSTREKVVEVLRTRLTRVRQQLGKET